MPPRNAPNVKTEDHAPLDDALFTPSPRPEVQDGFKTPAEAEADAILAEGEAAGYPDEPAEKADTRNADAAERDAAARAAAVLQEDAGRVSPLMDQGGKDATAKSKRTSPVRLHYDAWGEDGQRHVAGSVVDLPTDQVRRLLNEGKAERADPLPGED